MKKGMSLILAIVLCLGLMGIATAETPTYSGNVTFCLDAGTDTDFDTVFREPFSELYPDIDIELISVNALDRLEKIMVMLTSGNGPDVMIMEQSYYTTLVPTGYMYPLDELAEKDADFDFSAFDDNGIKYYQSFDGKTYSVPISPYYKVLMFNKNTFAKYGVDVPHYGMTMEDLIETARALQAKMVEAGDDKKDIRPFCQWEIHLEPLTSQMGVGLYTTDPLGPNVYDEKVQKAIGFWSTLWNENMMITKEEAKAKGYGDSYKLFADGEYPMIIENAWIMQNSMDASLTTAPWKGVYDVIPVPPFAGEPNQQPPVSQHGIGLSKDVRDPEAAFQVLKFAAENWYDNKAELSHVYSPSSFKASKQNVILTGADYFPNFKYVMEQPMAFDPPINTDIHDEIVWTSVREVNAEAAITKLSQEQVSQQIEEAINAVINRYQLSQ